eukprot:CAMPEP_0179885068 /NCGR_PEP_ID=MMETSP0982-20121206/30057_1 /TAXON_ID=483367 /ORGANISM="non described non described, Strain CCMP 2436" /LENGTH=159 /DNA_ID=CAMNT_0021780571 /DNA_START=209 /DNA_END=688 /DNA_ORIENTATION=+
MRRRYRRSRLRSSRYLAQAPPLSREAAMRVEKGMRYGCERSAEVAEEPPCSARFSSAGISKHWNHTRGGSRRRAYQSLAAPGVLAVAVPAALVRRRKHQPSGAQRGRGAPPCRARRAAQVAPKRVPPGAAMRPQGTARIADAMVCMCLLLNRRNAWAVA